MKNLMRQLRVDIEIHLVIIVLVKGGKMRIDLAFLFTCAIAKMKNSTNTNLLILDEIFDSSLDGQGTEDFFKILRTMTNENVFIISHKGDILFDKFTNIIKFDKEHNFTKLEEVK